MTKIERFRKMAHHANRVELALLEAMPELYGEDLADEIIAMNPGTWKQRVLADLDAAKLDAYGDLKVRVERPRG